MALCLLSAAAVRHRAASLGGQLAGLLMVTGLGWLVLARGCNIGLHLCAGAAWGAGLVIAVTILVNTSEAFV